MKKFWQSKTFWVNVISIAIGLADQFLGYQFLSPVVHGYIIAGLNLILRLFFTSTKVTV